MSGRGGEYLSQFYEFGLGRNLSHTSGGSPLGGLRDYIVSQKGQHYNMTIVGRPKSES